MILGGKMTTKERKRIIRLLFQTIKSLYGIQEKLNLVYFNLLEIAYNDEYFPYQKQVKSGWFKAETKSGKMYKFHMERFDQIDHLEII
jgi:hypothetical protein